MTDQTKSMDSKSIQAAIAKAEGNLETLTTLMDDLQAEQRKLAALATLGLLEGAKAGRQKEVAEEIALVQARQTELRTGIDGARELLERTLTEEAAAQAKADWEEAEALLKQAGEVARAAQAALENAGSKYSELSNLIERAVSLGCQHVPAQHRYAMADLGRCLELAELFALALRNAGGPDHKIVPTYVCAAHPHAAPTIETAVAGCIRKFAEARGHAEANDR
ncbi:hypothetical protein FBY14_110174 [Azospirillum brasilense]|nr:hypothetical protein FBY14_110174 [Azospirillum brasilense]